MNKIDYICQGCEQKKPSFPNPCQQTDKQKLACAYRIIEELEKLKTRPLFEAYKKEKKKAKDLELLNQKVCIESCLNEK